MTAAGRGQDSSCPQRGDLDHHLERLAEQKSPTSTLASLPHNMRAASLPAPHLAFVHDVVVQQRGRVHEFDRGRELDVAGAVIPGQRAIARVRIGPQPLAAGRDQVIGDLGNHRHLRSRARQNGRVDATHVGGDEVDQTVDGGGRMAFKWDDNGQEEGSEQKDARE
jgi:hypothetical protein